jgi:ribosomal protein S4, bacterial/organelle type
MARNFTPVVKRCRQLGIEPGFMGYSKKQSKRQPAQQRRKESEYGKQLREKQKVKFIYGVLERQFRGYYDKIVRQEGVKGENLLRILERRLDNVVYRMGFARTRAEARQMVSHGQFTVNGQRVNIPSYLVTPGERVGIVTKARNSDHLKAIAEETSYRVVPAWLQSDRAGWEGEVLALPTREQIDLPVNETLIIELYSR